MQAETDARQQKRSMESAKKDCRRSWNEEKKCPHFSYYLDRRAKKNGFENIKKNKKRRQNHEILKISNYICTDIVTRTTTRKKSKKTIY